MRRMIVFVVLVLIAVLTLNGCKKKEKKDDKQNSINIENVTPNQDDDRDSAQTEQKNDNVTVDNTKQPKPNAQKGSNSKDDESASVKDVITIIDETTGKGESDVDGKDKIENITPDEPEDKEPESDSTDGENPFNLDKDGDGFIDGWH